MTLKRAYSLLVVVVGIVLSTAIIISQSPKTPQTPHLSSKQTYTVQQDASHKPRILEVSIDPPDVHVGYEQHLSLTLESPTSVLVTAETLTDSKTIPLVLGLAKEEGLIKTYEASWIVEDTHDATYHTTFSATDGEGNRNQITIAWTDPCGIPPGGDWTMTTDCIISSSDGVDNGNITIQSGTLTLNAPLAFNQGKSLNVIGGTILKGTSGSIIKSNIYQIDADGDGYPANSTMYLSSTAPINGRRRNLLSATIDCNDGAFSSTNTCTAPQCWPDADGDGYFSVNATTGCTGSYSTSQGNDCYDANANAKPGQVNYYATDRGDGSFDYNCDGIESMENTAIGKNACNVQLGYCDQTGWDSPQNSPACGATAQIIIDPGYCNGNRCFTQNQQQTCR